MASGWTLWVWLQCIGVVSECCCKEVHRFPLILLIPTPLVLALFCSIIPTSWFIFLMFYHSFLLFLCNIANIAQRTFEIVQKSRSCGHGDIIISTSTSTTSPETPMYEVP